MEISIVILSYVILGLNPEMPVPSGQGKITPPVKSTTIMPLTAGLRCPLPECADSRDLVLISAR